MVHEIAEQQEMMATFMPKPFSNLTGNGAISISPCGTKRELFQDKTDTRGLGLSATAYQFLGGLRRTLALSAVPAPTVNSYKRLKSARRPAAHVLNLAYIAYGDNNRTAFACVSRGRAA